MSPVKSHLFLSVIINPVFITINMVHIVLRDNLFELIITYANRTPAYNINGN
jgi:hypothetical protein